MWHGEPFTGVAFEESNGRVVEELSFVDGIQHGVAREWYPSGRLRVEWHYYRNVRHGISREFDENGRLASEAVHEYGIKTRERRWEGDRLVESYELPADDPRRDKLARRRETEGWPAV